MPVAVLAFLCAIGLAGVAAWFSITGLIAIFAALAVPIAIMAAVLEVSKLVTASLVYRHWYTLSVGMKTYLTSAVVILMLITSLGIYGYLSKAHLDQDAPVSNNIAKIERIDQRIEREQRKIRDAEIVLDQLDDTIDTLIEYDKISGPDGARSVRESQADQRGELTSEINAAQQQIDEYTDDKFDLEQTVRDFEAEIGPIKYVAALFYSEPEQHYDTAVRGIILLLIFVFDPLAIVLLLSANHIQMQQTGTRKQTQLTTTETTSPILDTEEHAKPIEVVHSDVPHEDTDPDTTDILDAFDVDDEPVEQDVDLEEEPVEEPVDLPPGVNEYTSPHELESQSGDVLYGILALLDKREEIRPLSTSEMSRRSAIVDILRRRGAKSWR